MAKPRTLFEKIWDSHVVATEDDGTCLLYIDRHLTHEVTTPQPYEGLRQAGRKVRRPDATIAVIDHNIATDRSEGVSEDSQLQIDTLIRNCEEFGVPLFHFDDPRSAPTEDKRASMQRALDYMGLAPGTHMTDVAIDRVFVGSCTNGRIEDLREVAAIAKGRKVADGVRAMIVPGSGLVKRQAEDEGIADILLAAGFEWREPGCSMCLAMNPDRLEPGERCASTTNRNFVGRQGREGRTHLVSPAMAAAAAVTGRLTDVRDLIR